MRTSKLSKERLFDLYVNQNLHPKQIARLHNCERSSIYKWLQFYQIPLRVSKYPTSDEIYNAYITEGLQETALLTRLGISHNVLFRLLRKYGIRKNAAKLDSALSLSQEQREYLVGWLLGDGYIRRLSDTTAHFSFGQMRDKAGYVRWVHNRLMPFSLDLRFTTEKYWYQNKAKVAYKCRFESHSHTAFYEFHKMFYASGKKTVPLNLADFFTVKSLAVWYMDDGWARCGKLATNAFTPSEVKFLGEMCKNKFGLDYQINYDGSQPILLLTSAQKFFELVSPYVWRIPCMHYKLPKRFLTVIPRDHTCNTPSDDMVLE